MTLIYWYNTLFPLFLIEGYWIYELGSYNLLNFRFTLVCKCNDVCIYLLMVTTIVHFLDLTENCIEIRFPFFSFFRSVVGVVEKIVIVCVLVMKPNSSSGPI